LDRAIDIKRRAQRCIQSGDLDGALAEYEKLIAADESDPYNYVLLADLLFKKGDHESASKRYLAAADAYEKAGLYKNAIAVGKKMMRLGLSAAAVLERLANLHALDGLATEATLYYQQYAEHQVREKKYKPAAEALRKAFDCCPENIKALERLAEVYDLLEDDAAVARTLAEAAAAYEKAGQASDAQRCRTRAEKKQPGSVAAFASAPAPEPEAPKPAGIAPVVEATPEPGVVTMSAPTETPAEMPAQPAVASAPAGESASEALEIESGMESVASQSVEADRPPVFVPPDREGIEALDVDRHVQAPSPAAKAPEPKPAIATEPAPVVEPEPIPAAPVYEEPAHAQAEPVAAPAHEDAVHAEGNGKGTADSIEAVERMLSLAQTEFRAGNRESAAQILVRAAQSYEALGKADNAASIYRSLCKGPHGTTAMVELWFQNCERRDDRREGSTVACDLGDRALQENDADAARTWFDRALRLDGNNAVARRRLDRMNQVSRGAPVAEAPPAPPAAAKASAPATPAPAPAPAPAASEPSEEGKVEVAIGRGQAVTFDFASMLAEFQRGVETQLSGDAQAHYDLAMAYREMGLVQQAVDSFRLAAQDKRFKQRCAEMIGHCLLEDGRLEDAIQELTEALADSGLAPEATVGIRFQLGLALEAAGRFDESLHQFERVFDIQANYPEVAQKIRSLRKHLEAA
jgi:tetratricopeptide (TPR) repeat protein